MVQPAEQNQGDDMTGKDQTLYGFGSDPMAGEITIPGGDHPKKPTVDTSFPPQPPGTPLWAEGQDS